jgi:cytidine deaminase
MLEAREQEALLILAAWARRNAYAPYSRYTVGAAVVAADNRTFYGGNVEKPSLRLGPSAERTAMAAAVGSGARRVRALALVTDTSEPGMPCGACLQLLAEFARPSALVISATVSGRARRTRVGDLFKELFEL